MAIATVRMLLFQWTLAILKYHKKGRIQFPSTLNRHHDLAFFTHSYGTADSFPQRGYSTWSMSDWESNWDEGRP